MKSRKADNRPSMQFYPKDWLSDVGLQSCSYKAKGLWMDLICYMWMSPERGLLKFCHYKSLNKMSTKEFGETIKELVDNKVCEITQKKAIICRKMRGEFLKERHISLVRSEASSGTKDKQNENKNETKGQQNTHPSSASPSPSPSPSPIVLKEYKETPTESHLINLWKSKNREFLNAYPSHLKKFVRALGVALKNGWLAPDAEKRIFETAGKDVPPWDLFKERRTEWTEILSGKKSGS
jgi:hypothetical protein